MPAIATTIAEVVLEIGIEIVEFIFSLGEVKVIKNIVEWGARFSRINCAIQWYGYISLIKASIEMLEGFGVGENAIKALLKSSGINIPSKINAKDFLNNNLNAVSENVRLAKELEARAKLEKSVYSGVHKPPYHSIAIHEVVYEYSNIVGYGSMVIIFNPEGFGMKPRPPQIVRYVTEAEFAEFSHSKSWGEYWRVNYLLGRRKRKPHDKLEGAVLGSEETTVTPVTENLDDYIERVLDLPEYADTVIANEMAESITYALEKQQDLTKQMVTAIEKGQLGRKIDSDGLRITDILNQKIDYIPQNLSQIIKTNPVFKDVIKVTNTYDIYINRLRSIKERFVSAGFRATLNAQALALGETLGSLSSLQAAVLNASGGLFKIGADLGIESAKGVGGVAAARTELLVGQEQMWSLLETKEQLIDRIGGQNVSVDELKKLADADSRVAKLLDPIIKGAEGGFIEENILYDLIDSEFVNANAAIFGFQDAIALQRQQLVGDVISGTLKPPKCKPI